MSQSLIETRHLCAFYGKVQALSDIALHVRAGQVVTVIGPNGAGKSTLLASLMGMRRTTGEVFYEGRAMAHVRPEHRVGQGLCLVTERRDLFGTMSVMDNLALGAFSRRASRQELKCDLEQVFAMFPRLLERRDQKAHTLSGGERQMLALGRALMGKPRLLMLDEPSLGLAPLVVREVFRAIALLKGRGVSILLVEQNARSALEVADHAYVLEMGAVVMEGPASSIAGDRRIVDSYLGTGPLHDARPAADPVNANLLSRAPLPEAAVTTARSLEHVV